MLQNNTPITFFIHFSSGAKYSGQLMFNDSKTGAQTSNLIKLTDLLNTATITAVILFYSIGGPCILWRQELITLAPGACNIKLFTSVIYGFS